MLIQVQIILMKAGFEYTEKNVEFGAATDTPEIYFVAAVDIDHEIIKIPYKKKAITVKQLIWAYTKITSHMSKFKGGPCLRVLNGTYRKKIAEEKMTLINLNVFVKQVCFRVQDSSNPNNDFSDVAQYIKEASEVLKEENLFQVVFSFQNKKFQLPLSKKSTIEKVISSLIKFNNELKFSTDELVLSLDGNTLNDKQLTLEQLQLDDKEIKVYVIKKLGCFKSTTKVLLADRTEKDIGKIQIGDQICVFNREKKKIQTHKVAHIYETLVNQSIMMTLEKGIAIQTTPNNLFLRSDGTFRLIRSEEKKEQCLATGDRLMFDIQQDGKYIEIESIQNKLIPPEVFYNICTDSPTDNNTIIVEGIVSHHQFIKIRAPEGQIQSIDVSPSQNFGSIKQKLEAIYFLNKNHQKLTSAGKFLKDSETLRDKNISTEASLYLRNIPFNKFNLIHQNALISLTDNNKKSVAVKNLTKEDEILCVDPNDFNIAKNGAKVVEILKEKIDECVVIELEDQKLKVCPQTYILLEDGDIILASEICKRYEQGSRRFRMQIKTKNGPASIEQVSLVKTTETFYKIESLAHNFIINDIIIPNSVLKVVCEPIGKSKTSWILNISHDKKIDELKQVMAKKTKIQPKSQNIWFNNSFINQGDKTLVDTHMTNESVVFIQEKRNKQPSSIFGTGGLNQQEIQFGEEKEKHVCFQFPSTNKKYTLSYQLFKDWKISKILSQYMKIEDHSYFLMFQDIFIFSNETLSKMEKAQSFENDSTVLVIKNEKLAFLTAMAIRSEAIHNSSCIRFDNQQILKEIPELSQIKVPQPEELQARINHAVQTIEDRVDNKFLRRQHFYKPFLLFTSRKYHEQIHDYIKNFEEHRTQIDLKDSVFAIIKDLYQNMSLLSNHLNICYYGLRNFKAGFFMNEGYTFYLYNFTLAYKDRTKVAEELKGNGGTLFRIQSTSGKYISPFSLNPDKKEILFAPFTYFLVQKVIQGEGDEMDEVWITEVSSPVTFSKDIILWVDDRPSNNLMQYNIILNLKPDLEILQVTSTAAALKWMKEFGWILNWKGVGFKLISDMHRLQIKENKEVDVPEAGIQLLEQLYVKKGYTAKTMIFCFRDQIARDIAKKRNISEDRFQITKQQEELDKFIGIQKNS